MPRDLEADLKLCEAAEKAARFSSSGISFSTMQLAAGWLETILELMEARKRIAEVETVIERYRISMNRARKTVEELEDVLDE